MAPPFSGLQGHNQRHLPPGLPLDIGNRRIGLLGGSFNPAHDGHVHISHLAKARLGLDEIWWLVSPQNPLKSPDATGTLSRRMLKAKEITSASRFIKIIAPEAALGTRYTLDFARWLRRRYGNGQFVWLMGADNLAGFHLWQGWRQIAELLPIAVIDRPGYRHKAAASKAARALEDWRWPEARASELVGAEPPAWSFLHGPLSAQSSTAIRARANETNAAS